MRDVATFVLGVLAGVILGILSYRSHLAPWVWWFEDLLGLGPTVC